MDARLTSVLDKATDLVDDSRLVVPGAVFVAMQGLKRHGLAGVDEAIERGASAIIHDGLADEADRARLAGLKVPVVECDRLKDLLPELLNYFWKQPAAALMLHAVTGTNGKSSIAWLLAQALDGAMIGTLGVGRPGRHHKSHLTTPSLLSVYRHLAEFRNQGIEHVVLEASSHALVQGRLAGLSFESTIFTNLGHDHLDYHGDRGSYGEAKARLFRDHSAKLQLFNVDDAFGEHLFDEQQNLTQVQSTEVIGFSIHRHPKASVWLNIQPSLASGGHGLGGSLQGLGTPPLTMTSRLLGEVNGYNLVVCAAVLNHLGWSEQAIKTRLAELDPPPGRMESITLPKDQSAKTLPRVIVDYAHSPDALKQALVMVRSLTQGQVWCVFGCGGDRDPSKRAPMGRIAEAFADRVILTDDNPRHESSLAIIRGIQSGMRQPERARVLLDRTQAIETAVMTAGSEDVVLIAGKGHETEQLVGDKRLEMDDRALAKEALSQRSMDQQEAC